MGLPAAQHGRVLRDHDRGQRQLQHDGFGLEPVEQPGPRQHHQQRARRRRPCRRRGQAVQSHDHQQPGHQPHEHAGGDHEHHRRHPVEGPRRRQHRLRRRDRRVPQRSERPGQLHVAALDSGPREMADGRSVDRHLLGRGQLGSRLLQDRQPLPRGRRDVHHGLRHVLRGRAWTLRPERADVCVFSALQRCVHGLHRPCHAVLRVQRHDLGDRVPDQSPGVEDHPWRAVLRLQVFDRRQQPQLGDPAAVPDPDRRQLRQHRERAQLQPPESRRRLGQHRAVAVGHLVQPAGERPLRRKPVDVAPALLRHPRLAGHEVRPRQPEQPARRGDVGPRL